MCVNYILNVVIVVASVTFIVALASTFLFFNAISKIFKHYLCNSFT